MEQNKKYWLITSEYPPLYGGGIGTYCYQAAQMMVQNGWDVTVFVPAKNARKDNIKSIDKVRVVEFILNRTDAWNYLGYDTALSFEFAKVIDEYLNKEGVPGVLESQEYAGIAYFILQYKHLGYPLFKDLKVMLTLHAPSFLYYDYNRVPTYQLPYFWIGEMERWCIVAADILNAPSRFMVEAIQPYFSSELQKTVHVLPYPFEQINKALNFEDDPRKKWFFFGKLTPQKGILKLLSAYKRLWRENWPHDLIVIGGGDHYYHPENMSIWYWIKKKFSAEIKSKRLHLLGNLAPAKWQKLTERGGVVIIPSIGDNYPFTVLESMSNGHIVLASKQGGQSELVKHGINGFLFDHNKPNDLEEKIKEIAQLPANQIKIIRQKAVEAVGARHAYKWVYPQKRLLLDKLEKFNSQTLFPFTREISVKQNLEVEEKATKDLLSVVIPYYNMDNYIEETIKSVKASQYQPIELIVLDDGSDNKESVEKLNVLKEKYNFKVFAQVNMGLAAARNAGAKAATGQFLAFLDADDKVHPQYYSKAVSILKEKTNVSFVGSWVQYFENSNGLWPAFTPEPPYLLYFNMVCSGGLVYKTNHFLNAGLNDPMLEYGLEDWDSVISMVKKGCHGVVIPEPLYFYRIRNQSMARKFTKEKLLYSTKYIAKKHEDFYIKFVADLSSLYNANGPGFKIDNPTLDYNNYGLVSARFPLVKKAIKVVKRIPVLKKMILKIHSIIKK